MRGIFQNPNPLNLTYHDVKKFDLQYPIIGKLATQVKATRLTEDQLTKRILMQDQISKIENRLELRKPINVDDNSDDDTGAPGGGGDVRGGDDGTPPRLPHRDEFDNLTTRLNRLCMPLAPPRTTRRPCVPRSDVKPDLRDILNDRLYRLRYGSIAPNKKEKTLVKRLSERQREIARIPIGTV